MNVDVSLFKPNCTIWLGASKSIDPSYNHVYAIGLGEEEAFLNKMLSNKNKYGDFIKVENCTPVKDEVDGYIRLPFGIGGLTANYLIWKNQDEPPYTPMYAFIEDIKFVNIHCVSIKATLDVFRTYLPRIVFRPCIMDRSHFYQGADEQIGDNLYKEPVSDKVYYKRAEFIIDELKSLSLMLVTRFTGDNIQVYPFGNLIRQFIFTKFDSPFDTSLIADTLAAASGRVVSFTVVPNFMAFGEGSGFPRIITKTFKYPETIDNYKPRNKKLLTYPFIFHECITPTGSRCRYRLELATKNPKEGADINYRLAGLCTGQDSKLWFFPEFYEGYIANGEFPSLSVNDNVITFNSFPELPVSSDAWNAAVNNQSILSMLGGLNSSLLSGGIVGAAGVAQQTAHQLANGIAPSEMSFSGFSAVGLLGVIGAEASAINSLLALDDTPISTSSGSVGLADFMTGNAPFTMSLVHIDNKYAENLDNFFDVYGYKDPNLRVVDIKLRPHWCYWKSTGVCAFGGQSSATRGTEVVPAYAINIINQCMMNGVTFWNQDDNLGAYFDSGGKIKDNHT